MFNRLARDHFGVEQGVTSDLAHEIAIVTIGPIHHWRYAERVVGEHENVELRMLN